MFIKILKITNTIIVIALEIIINICLTIAAIPYLLLTLIDKEEAKLCRFLIQYKFYKR